MIDGLQISTIRLWMSLWCTVRNVCEKLTFHARRRVREIRRRERRRRYRRPPPAHSKCELFGFLYYWFRCWWHCGCQRILIIDTMCKVCGLESSTVGSRKHFRIARDVIMIESLAWCASCTESRGRYDLTFIVGAIGVLFNGWMSVWVHFQWRFGFKRLE